MRPDRDTWQALIHGIDAAQGDLKAHVAAHRGPYRHTLICGVLGGPDCQYFLDRCELAREALSAAWL